MDYFMHESAVIDTNVQIGKGCKIWHFSHILSGSVIGENCSFGQNCVVGPNVRVGSGCKVQNNVSIYEGVELENDVFLGPSMVFTNVNNPRAFINRREEFRKTLLKKGASIGANVTIVCGVSIGEYAFVGAGSVVVRDVPSYALMVGVPARQIGWVDKAGLRLEFDSKGIAIDSYDKTRYRLVEERLEVIYEN
ncbi:N-acetyltransferase [Helicobacter sp. MIT 11-5569]|uniref:acyltransferase n=1 Tax=Helicobacter sp. MIT 11-5569 TaxID=1548151 RepID=UPI00051FBCDE|nr:acyltransferase [Helicobacter sp. MIT 11-5569]TLD81369.1 N-acetyltransferase [Helicobacter sp. MIT 11-5569]